MIVPKTEKQEQLQWMHRFSQELQKYWQNKHSLITSILLRNTYMCSVEYISMILDLEKALIQRNIAIGAALSNV